MIRSKLRGATVQTTLMLHSSPLSRSFSNSKHQKLISILKKPETSTANIRPSHPMYECIFFTDANSGIPASNVSIFDSLKGKSLTDTMQEAIAFVTPDQWADMSPAPRGFPRLRETNTYNTDFDLYDPNFHYRQQQIGQIKNRLRNQGFMRNPEDEHYDGPPHRPW